MYRAYEISRAGWMKIVTLCAKRFLSLFSSSIMGQALFTWPRERMEGKSTRVFAEAFCLCYSVCTFHWISETIGLSKLRVHVLSCLTFESANSVVHFDSCGPIFSEKQNILTASPKCFFFSLDVVFCRDLRENPLLECSPPNDADNFFGPSICPDIRIFCDPGATSYVCRFSHLMFYSYPRVLKKTTRCLDLCYFFKGNSAHDFRRTTPPPPPFLFFFWHSQGYYLLARAPTGSCHFFSLKNISPCSCRFTHSFFFPFLSRTLQLLGSMILFFNVS